MNEYYKTCAFPKPMKKKHRTPTVSDKTYYKVFNTCKGKCVLCGKQTQLQLHHVLSRGRNLTDDYKHCVMLCMECHLYKVHENQRKYRPILLNICEELYGDMERY
jgi:5-methylcytosine-specific restriction endonuclease McrA